MGTGGKVMANNDSGAALSRYGSNWERVSGSVKTVAVVAASVEILAYLALWWASQRFYSSFGLIPQDVGFGDPSVILTSFVMLTIFMMTSTAPVLIELWAFVAIVAVLVRVALRPPGHVTRRRFVWVLAAGFTAATTLGWLSSAVISRNSDIGPVVPLLTWLCVFPAVMWIGIARLEHDSVTGVLASLWLDVVRYARWVSLISVSVAFLASVVLMQTTAPLDAASVQAGIPRGGANAFWAATPVSVAWMSRPAADPVHDDCVMYLGGSGGYIVLYDVTAQTTVKVPASDVSMAVKAHTHWSCAPPNACARIWNAVLRLYSRLRIEGTQAEFCASLRRAAAAAG
jgi:hypothetical protein